MIGTASASRRSDRPPFTGYVSCGMPALAELAGVPYHLLFRNAEAIIRAYREGLPRLRERFGPEVRVLKPGWSPTSYGHVNALGCKLLFPEESEVGITHPYATLGDAIRTLQAPRDLATQGLFPFYLELWRELKRAFPDEQIPFVGFDAEGPLTTAWCLRGQGFFLDVYDDPTAVKELLRLVTDSIVEYKRLLAAINGQTQAVNPAEAHIADDISAMLGPELWPEFVVPFLDQYYRGATTGRRLLHMEGLAVQHLAYLDELRIDLFDPSVSPNLTAALVRDHCRVPFIWRLNAMQLRSMSESQIEHWLLESAAAGPTAVFFIIERSTCDELSARKVRRFIATAQRLSSPGNRGAGERDLRLNSPPNPERCRRPGSAE